MIKADKAATTDADIAARTGIANADYGDEVRANREAVVVAANGG